MAIDPFSSEGLSTTDLGVSAQNLPPEYAGNLMKNLDAILGAQEQKQTKSYLDQQEERGLFRSGQTDQGLVDNVLQPGIDKRREALLQLVGTGLNQGRDERLQGTAYNRQVDFQGILFDQKMKELEQQASNSRSLLELQAQLGIGMPSRNKPGFEELLANGFASGLGSSLGHRVGG